MAKKRDTVMKDFIFGIILFVVIQAIFMLGGLYIENSNGIPITGIPSALGLTVVLLLGLYFRKQKKDYVIIGSFILAFIAPLILYLIVLFNAMEFLAPHIQYSITYMVLVILFVWAGFIIKVFRKGK